MIQRAQLKILTAPEWRGQYRDLVGKGATPNEAAKELSGGFALRKDFTGTLLRKGPQQGDEVEKTYDMVFSNETIDRDWDSIRLAGWQLQNYRKNPVVLWAHDSSSLPIGRTKKIWKSDGNLIGSIAFTPDELNPLGGVVARMLDGGWLNAGSVGFLPMELEPAPEEERQRRYGLNFIKHELLEESIVPVPSNPTALQLAMNDLGTKNALLWLAKAHEAGINTEPWRKWAESVLHRPLKGLAVSDLEEACEELGKAGRLIVQVVRSSEGELMVQSSVAGMEEAEVPIETDPIVTPVLEEKPTPEPLVVPPVAVAAVEPVPLPAPASAPLVDLSPNFAAALRDFLEKAKAIQAPEPVIPVLTFARQSDGSYLALVNGDVKCRVESCDDVELGEDGIVRLAAPQTPNPSPLPAPAPRKSVPTAPVDARVDLAAAMRRAVEQVIRERQPAGT